MPKHKIVSETTHTDCTIIPIFEEEQLAPQVSVMSEKIHENVVSLFASKDFEGKHLQQSFVYNQHDVSPRTLLIGLGKKEDCTIEKWKKVVGSATIAAQNKKCKKIKLVIPQYIIDLFGIENTAQEGVIAAHTAAYSFDQHKEEGDRTTTIDTIFWYLDSSKTDAWEAGLASGIHIAESVNFARHLGNTPPSEMTPESLANAAKDLGKEYTTLTVNVLEKEKIKELGMGCLLGVSQGSILQPKFIIIEYLHGKQEERPMVFVGKGITFDSGGLSLKPDPYIRDMKFDMLGAATVLGILRAAAALGLKQNIVGLVPTCENMPSGSSYRPDDILRAMNGKTVLIQNTDAEGRLILADALSYASQYKPKHVVDFATLTGACVVALGNERSGLFTKDDNTAIALQKAAEKTGEKLWRLPLGEEYSEAMKCEVADLKNIGGVGGARYAGASTAAAFLEYFTDYPWTHIDLSCSSYGEKGKSWIRGGANGFGVQTIISYLKNNA
ncbi:MAG: leucyl aminopeptidase [Candidatus Magasanikbacteria bacterium]|nr:leucyl aminopeptidase [Candidatus Magasanikbacteria bacterium]|tara:strand:+ start:881 stop:2374 length:1494 start_codon:yes stop_codon:yes gene_type:complete